METLMKILGLLGLLCSVNVALAGITIIGVMTPQTWHPYRFSMVALSVGAFGESVIWFRGWDGAASAEKEIASVLMLLGLCGLFLLERRRRSWFWWRW